MEIIMIILKVLLVGIILPGGMVLILRELYLAARGRPLAQGPASQSEGEEGEA